MQNLAVTSQFGNSGRRGNLSSNSFQSLVLNGVLPPNEDGRVEAVWTFKPDSPLGPGYWYDNLFGNHPGYRQNDPAQDGIDWQPGKSGGGGGGTPYVPPRGNNPIRDLVNAGQRVSDSVMAEANEAARKWAENQRINDLIDNIILNGALDKIYNIIKSINEKSKNKNTQGEHNLIQLFKQIRGKLKHEVGDMLKNKQKSGEINIGYGEGIIIWTQKMIDASILEGMSFDIFKIVLEEVQEDLSGGEFKGYFRLALFDNAGNLLFEQYFW